MSEELKTTTKTKYTLNQSGHPGYKIRRPKVSVPKRYVVMSPNKAWLRAMVVAIHEQSQKTNKGGLYSGQE